MVSGLQGNTYEERLRELNMESLVNRRKRFDMIQTFKILTGIDKVPKDIWFRTVRDEQNRRPTRLVNHELDLITTETCRTDLRKNFFSQRVITSWNSLPNYVKDSRSISAFKSNYNKFVEATAEY